MFCIASPQRRQLNREFFGQQKGETGQEGVGDAILITKCPIRNLFAKKMLMLYNKNGCETVLIVR
jgi:hypothetical protein